MKKILFVCVCTTLFHSLIWGQTNTQTRRYILEKFTVFYIDNPSAAMPAPGPALQAMEVDTRTIHDGGDLTTSALWTNANNAGLKNLLIKLLRSPGGTSGGDANLQRIVRNVLMITGKKVKVYLYNDAALSGSHNSSWSIFCPAGTNYPTGFGNRSWPCANVITDPDYTGHIAMGNYFYQTYSASEGWKLATFIHELSHTQLAVNNTADLPSTIPMYGSDTGHHTYDELIPSYNLAFNEGLANGYAFRYHLGGNGMAAWFNTNVSLYVDDISCSSAAQTYCLQSRLAANTPPLAGTAGTVSGHAVKRYPIQNIPAPILMYNENMYANVFYQFMSQFQSGERFLSESVKNAIPSFSTTRPFAAVYKEMVKKGLNFRHSAAPAGVVTHGQHLPLGILDFYTGYRINSKATLEACLGTTWNATDPNIDEYFSSKRNVLVGFRASPPDWQVQQLSRFAEHLYVKINPSATPPASTSGN